MASDLGAVGTDSTYYRLQQVYEREATTKNILEKSLRRLEDACCVRLLWPLSDQPVLTCAAPSSPLFLQAEAIFQM